MDYNDLRLRNDILTSFYMTKRMAGRNIQMYNQTSQDVNLETGEVVRERSVVDLIGVVNDLQSQLARSTGNRALVFGLWFEPLDRMILLEYESSIVFNEYTYFIIDNERFNYIEHKTIGPRALIVIKARGVQGELLEQEKTMNVEQVLTVEQDLNATL